MESKTDYSQLSQSDQELLKNVLLHFFTSMHTITSFKYYSIEPPDKPFYKQNSRNLDQHFPSLKCVMPSIIPNFKLNRLQFAYGVQTTNHSATSTTFVSLKALCPEGACITKPVLNVSKSATLDRQSDPTTLSSVAFSSSRFSTEDRFTSNKPPLEILNWRIFSFNLGDLNLWNVGFSPHTLFQETDHFDALSSEEIDNIMHLTRSNSSYE